MVVLGRVVSDCYSVVAGQRGRPGLSSCKQKATRSILVACGIGRSGSLHTQRVTGSSHGMGPENAQATGDTPFSGSNAGPGTRPRRRGGIRPRWCAGATIIAGWSVGRLGVASNTYRLPQAIPPHPMRGREPITVRPEAVLSSSASPVELARGGKIALVQLGSGRAGESAERTRLESNTSLDLSASFVHNMRLDPPNWRASLIS